MAGQLQGLLPGDLGDLGEASVSLRWIEDTIDLLISHYSDVSDETGLVESELGDSRKRHLELIAHLLLCGQRLFLSITELKTDALSAIFTRNIEANLTRPHEGIQSNGYSEVLPTVSPDIILQSPFWKRVVIPLYCATSLRSSDLLSHGNVTAPHGRLLATLNEQSREKKRTPVALVRHLLQIVSVCAAMFPAGGCWTTKNYGCWYQLPLTDNEENLFDSRVIIPPRNILGSSPEDLAILLNIIAGILTVHGEMSGDSSLQL